MVAATMIKEHMEILASDGVHVGTVDRVEGSDRIKVSRNDPLSEGEHHYFPLDWVDHVDTKVHIKPPSSEIMARWKAG